MNKLCLHKIGPELQNASFFDCCEAELEIDRLITKDQRYPDSRTNKKRAETLKQMDSILMELLLCAGCCCLLGDYLCLGRRCRRGHSGRLNWRGRRCLLGRSGRGVGGGHRAWRGR